MGNRLANGNAGDEAFTSESVIVTINPYPYGPGTATSAPIFVRWEVTATGNGSTTGLVLRVRHAGGTTGIPTGQIVLGPVTYTFATGGGTYSFCLSGVDPQYDGNGYWFTAANVGGLVTFAAAMGEAEALANAF